MNVRSSYAAVPFAVGLLAIAAGALAAPLLVQSMPGLQLVMMAMVAGAAGMTAGAS